MDVDFCERWEDSGFAPENKYCRKCSSDICDELWKIVKQLASQNNYEGITTHTTTGKPFRLYTTSEQSKYIGRFQSIALDRKGQPWNIPKEDFLYILKTDRNDTPSRTRQASHVKPVIELLRQRKESRELIDLIREL